MMPWFPRDFIAGTRAMRLAERGAYRDLLDYQWEMQKLPRDPDRLARLLGCSRQEFDEIWPAIADKFVVDGAFILNKRLEEHRDKAIRQRDKKIEAANKTNAKRYGERAVEVSLTETHSDTLSASPPSPSPSPSKKTEQRRKATDDARGTRIQIPFDVTDVMREWAHHQFPNVDVKAATAEFEDYWRGVPGQKGRKTDWEATWRNRIREVSGRVKPGNRPQTTTTARPFGT